MSNKAILQQTKLLSKVHHLSSEEIISDIDWPIIRQNPSLLYELLRTGNFHALTELPLEVFENISICIMLMNYQKPSLEFIPKEFFNNSFFIYSILDNNYSHIQYLSLHYLTDEIMGWFCNRFGDKKHIVSFISKSLLNKELCKILVSKNGINFNDLPEEFRNDIDVYSSAAFIYQKQIFSFSGTHIKSNPYFVTQILEEEPKFYSIIASSLKTPNFFLRQLKHIPNLLEYADENVKNNEHCVWESVKSSPSSLYYASERLLNIPSFALQLCQNMNSYELENSFGAWGQNVTSNQEFILSILPQLCESKTISLIHPTLKAEKEVMQKAIIIDPFWFKELTSPLKYEPNFLKECYKLLLETDQYLPDKYARANQLFDFLDSSYFEEPSYLLYLYNHFNSIFLNIIYPAISHYETDLIQEMKNAHEVGKNNLVTFIEKIKLHYSLEKDLIHHSKNHEVQKI